MNSTRNMKIQVNLCRIVLFALCVMLLLQNKMFLFRNGRFIVSIAPGYYTTMGPCT